MKGKIQVFDFKFLCRQTGGAEKYVSKKLHCFLSHKVQIFISLEALSCSCYEYISSKWKMQAVVTAYFTAPYKFISFDILKTTFYAFDCQKKCAAQ